MIVDLPYEEFATYVLAQAAVQTMNRKRVVIIDADENYNGKLTYNFFDGSKLIFLSVQDGPSINSGGLAQLNADSNEFVGDVQIDGNLSVSKISQIPSPGDLNNGSFTIYVNCFFKRETNEIILRDGGDCAYYVFANDGLEIWKNDATSSQAGTAQTMILNAAFKFSQSGFKRPRFSCISSASYSLGSIRSTTVFTGFELITVNAIARDITLNIDITNPVNHYKTLEIRCINSNHNVIVSVGSQYMNLQDGSLVSSTNLYAGQTFRLYIDNSSTSAWQL